MARKKMTFGACGYEGVGETMYDDERYIVCEDIEVGGCGAGACGMARAVAATAVPDKDGYYPCVFLEFEAGDVCDEEIPDEAVDCHPDNTRFNPDSESFSDEEEAEEEDDD